jgi:hypothetical protein
VVDVHGSWTVEEMFLTNRRVKRARCKARRRDDRWLAAMDDPRRYALRERACFRLSLRELRFDSRSDFAEVHEQAAARGDDLTVYLQVMKDERR